MKNLVSELLHAHQKLLIIFVQKLLPCGEAWVCVWGNRYEVPDEALKQTLHVMMYAAVITIERFEEYRQHTSPMSIDPKCKNGMLAAPPTMTFIFHSLRLQHPSRNPDQSAHAHLQTAFEYRPIADSASSRRHACHAPSRTGTPHA